MDTSDNITISPNGQYAYVLGNNSVFMYAISNNGATFTPLSTPNILIPGFAASQNSITITPNGQYAYLTCEVNNAQSNGLISMYSIGSNGILTPLSPATIASNSNMPMTVAITPNNNYAYVINSNNTNPNNHDTVSMYSIGSNGELIALNPSTVNIGASAFNMAITPDGMHAYATGYPFSIFNINNGILSPAQGVTPPTGFYATNILVSTINQPKM